MSDDDLRDLASLIALDAVDDVERARILKAVAQADEADRRVFENELAAVRATLVSMSEATAVEPPNQLRDRIFSGLDEHPSARGDALGSPARDRRRLRLAVAAAAAAVVLGVGGVIGYTVADRNEQSPPSQAEQIFAAPDVRTTTGTVAGGQATVTYSPSAGEGVLVMNDVPRPAPGTIYQMWLIGPSGPKLAGTMSDADVSPSTTAIISDMRGVTAVAFTVGDSATPDKMISAPVAELPLS
ncbi:anti-sigma factor domain-containing protein [Gordonia sp. PS3]|uniref:anti-sigma factor n=1 Tax=Gordonia TaxID=2053 RepID=UPI0005F09983|nr:MULTISPECIES: anti-sigma factor [Gordonia]KJR09001.1 anti-sigma-K factor RskA [Gordonia sihwensis]KXT57097.1 anti-sigma-K factor RskA [Gordonia sp. QH-12]